MNDVDMTAKVASTILGVVLTTIMFSLAIVRVVGQFLGIYLEGIGNF